MPVPVVSAVRTGHLLVLGLGVRLRSTRCLGVERVAIRGMRRGGGIGSGGRRDGGESSRDCDGDREKVRVLLLMMSMRSRLPWLVLSVLGGYLRLRLGHVRERLRRGLGRWLLRLLLLLGLLGERRR